MVGEVAKQEMKGEFSSRDPRLSSWITLVAAARPNFVKLAPLVRELKKRNVPFRWIHTGQHRGTMSDPFLTELQLPPPDTQLEARGTHAEMTATVMVGVERDLDLHRPKWLVVLGDVDSTLGAALAAVKLGVPIAHVEAGYRSNDWTMPEEINRVLVDRMSDLLFTPDEETHEHCNRREMYERKPGAHLYCVGNVMMDSLRWAFCKNEGRAPHLRPQAPYAVLTVHRPANVDTGTDWDRIYATVERTTYLPIMWPIHPRVSKDWRMPPNVARINPLGYLDMISLLRDASLVITDSGGVYEEALYLGKEIICLRDPHKNERAHLRKVPEIWKTDAAPRIVDALLVAS